MVTKFKKLTNGLASLGDGIDNDQKMRKIIRSLPPSREVKGTTLKELNDKEEMELIGLSGNLKTHEMERKAEKRWLLLRRKQSLSKDLPPSPTKMMKKRMMKISLFL